MGQEEIVSKQEEKNVEIASLNIPYRFLVSKIAPNCILRSNFLGKISAEVDFKAKKL